ncbi:MAG TPA: serine hydrolase domain-containing protein [Ideonella sp.]|uniref:serine hydrolase domain-containing protein n=1 Tax=Ideonella sp. TaxID=1929293 RepID=UPI002B5F0CB9|nr:serine hydrolase domain-containing protein [Ideonella sp.]HSI48065.1 serine hydrolase domain-containing protein [Ideonella sp.]
MASVSLDEAVRQLMQREQVNGLALAVIEHGQVAKVAAYGQRNVAKALPLTPDTVMYGASLTKAAFGYMVMQLADEGRLSLDAPLAQLLPQPLPSYGDAKRGYADLAGDERWRQLTPRMLLTHSSGFANFRWIEADQRLQFHFDPGSRYAYSGEGINLLQFVLEKGLGLDVGQEMQHRVFDRFGMTRTSMRWRPDFAGNLADGYQLDGSELPHDERSNVRAAGSMDTTIADQARMWAGFMRGEGLSPAARAEWIKAQLPITTAHQFPTLLPPTETRYQGIGLSAGLGVVRFDDAGGPAWFKGGHDDGTANMAVCLEAGQRCVLLLSNDVRAERFYPALVERVLGPTRLPWQWEYGWWQPSAP